MTQRQRSRGIPTPRPANSTFTQTDGNPQVSTIARVPVVYASAVAPAAGRTRWGILTGQCPLCGGRHIHFARSEEQVGGHKRSGCRRGTYWLAVNRVYRATTQEAA